MRRTALALLSLLLVALGGCVSGRGRDSRPGATQVGVASWYGGTFHGRRTANGEVYDMHGYTAAHRELPFGTWLEVENLATGRRVQVRVNDRGPFKRHRVLDLSFRAAKDLGVVGPGTARVRFTVLPEGPRPPHPPELYTVQVGAFSERDRAEVLRDSLRVHHADAVVRSDGVWHRVQVGEFAERGTAEVVRGELLRQGFVALVVLGPSPGS
jgi:rare lipoprotein A